MAIHRQGWMHTHTCTHVPKRYTHTTHSSASAISFSLLTFRLHLTLKSAHMIQKENRSDHFLSSPLFTDPSERLAVMLFVNGESYEWGSGASLDGTILASLSRVVVVTLNYRLGLFGEFCCSV